jgi:hypothetical protein
MHFTVDSVGIPRATQEDECTKPYTRGVMRYFGNQQYSTANKNHILQPKAWPFQKVMSRPEKATGLHSEKVGSGDQDQEPSPSACIYCRARGSIHVNSTHLYAL